MPKRTEEPKEGFTLPTLDLRPFTRDSKKISTSIFLKGFRYDDKQFLWIKAGSIDMRKTPEQGDKEQYTLQSLRLRGYTDCEHDSAKALTIPVVGLRMVTGWGGNLRFTGWIDFNPTRAEELRVFNPSAVDPEASVCNDERCGKPHPIVKYIPNPDPVLFDKIRGMEVEVFIGATDDPEESEGQS
jgi:hypothetical protein